MMMKIVMKKEGEEKRSIMWAKTDCTFITEKK
jgi:hypothetical protein